MNRTVILLLLALSLTGCNRIGEYIASKFGQWSFVTSTLEQDLKAEELYKALQNKDQTQVQSLLTPTLQQELKNKHQDFEKITQAIPREAFSSMEIINTVRTAKLGEGKTTTVVYRYLYPNAQVDFTVVFDGIAESTDIVGFHIHAKLFEQQSSEQSVELSEAASQAKHI